MVGLGLVLGFMVYVYPPGVRWLCLSFLFSLYIPIMMGDSPPPCLVRVSQGSPVLAAGLRDHACRVRWPWGVAAVVSARPGLAAAGAHPRDSGSRDGSISRGPHGPKLSPPG